MTTDFVRYLQELTEQGKVNMQEKLLQDIIEKCESAAKRGENYMIHYDKEFPFTECYSKLEEKGLKITRGESNSVLKDTYKISWSKYHD